MPFLFCNRAVSTLAGQSPSAVRGDHETAKKNITKQLQVWSAVTTTTSNNVAAANQVSDIPANPHLCPMDTKGRFNKTLPDTDART